MNKPSAGEIARLPEASFNAGVNAKWCCHFGRQFGSFSLQEVRQTPLR